MRGGDANHIYRLGFSHALQKGFPPHARVYQNRDCAYFHQGKNYGNEIYRGANHHQCPLAFLDAVIGKSVRVSVAQFG